MSPWRTGRSATKWRAGAVRSPTSGVHVIRVVDDPSPLREDQQVPRVRLDRLSVLLDHAGLRLFPIGSPEGSPSTNTCSGTRSSISAVSLALV